MTSKDTSIEYLKSVILNEYSSQIDYEIAAFYLAYYHKDSELQWLQSNLNTIPITDKSTPIYTMKFQKFVTDIIIKGYLGDQSAIVALQSAIDSMNYIVDKIIADRYLSEAGIYNNFDLIKNAFLDSNYRVYSLQGLRTYANNPQYRSEVISLLSEAIVNSTNANELSNYTYSLYWIDRDLTVELLDQKFQELSGWDRQSLFIDLYKFDPINQPRRSMWAIPLEPDENLRAYYIPFYPSIESGIYPKVYLQPYWINFLKSWYQTESSANIKDDIIWFIYDFKPLSINTDSSITIIDQIEYLKLQVDSVLNYTWLGDITFSNELKNILTTAKTNLQAGDSLVCRVQVKAFQDLVDNVYKDSLNADPRFVTIEGWKFLYWNAHYILDRLPEPPANPNLVVNLKNSLGNQIPASNVTYYEGSWKDAVNNGDGTFTIITTKPTVSIRMFYEYANQTVHNITAHNNTYTFHTVNASVELRNSSGNLIDQGTVQYYAGAWRTFGTTQNGVAYKELLPINYSFRMTYEYASIDKQQNLSTDPTIIFQTVNASVQLKNSSGNLIDQGTVQYYAGAWRTFGTTQNGVANKELLPINYSFRMTYEYVSLDKQQDISTNSTVTFSTVLCTVKVTKANGQPLSGAGTKYYSGAWRDIGLTNTNGETTKELLPKNLSFRATLGSLTQDKQQDIGVNSLVEIQLNVP
jgi:hypothetical protein